MSTASRLRDALPAEVVKRLQHLGGEGEQWLHALPGWLEQLRSDWSLELGEVLHGGSEALVIEAQAPDLPPAVLKLCVPEEPVEDQFPVAERKVLEVARGKGYASLLNVDVTGRAFLLQRLGSPLAALEAQTETRQARLCEALLVAWQANPEGLGLPTGAQKARWLRRLIGSLARDYPDALSSAAVALAVQFTKTREEAHERAHKVLVHGDPHEFNLLQAPADIASRARYLFIDPDGLYAEPEYDLGVVMREASEELMTSSTHAPVHLGASRARFLADLTQTGVRAVWEWGYIERVSSGLFTHSLGLLDYAQPALAVANSWAEQGAERLFAEAD